MLEAFEVVKNITPEKALEVVLTFEERQKSRYRTTTNCGQELGWFIERGTVLIGGDYLKCGNGNCIRVVAAPEQVSQISNEDALLLTRAAYHLGNRHVSLQIGEGFLRYQHDHVLDGMVKGLGLEVACLQLPFQPENGAYHGQGGHKHSESHDHKHDSHHH